MDDTISEPPLVHVLGTLESLLSPEDKPRLHELRDRLASGDLRALLVREAKQGRSTLLRALGLAPLMAQAGAFATATDLCLSVASGVHTHVKREEDRSLKSGAFDEELSRMSDLVDTLSPHALVLWWRAPTSSERRGTTTGGAPSPSWRPGPSTPATPTTSTPRSSADPDERPRGPTSPRSSTATLTPAASTRERGSE